jgi:serine protease
MRLKNSLLILAALLSPGLASAQSATQSSAPPEARVIVRFKAEADSVKARRMALDMEPGEVRGIAQNRAHALGMRRGLGARLGSGRSLDVRTQVVTARGMDSATLARQLAKDNEVEFVAVDQRRRIAAAAPAGYPNDTYYANASALGVTAGQWYLQTASSTPGGVVSSINAPAAWSVTTGSSSVVVAVIDTGVRFDHPDLAGQFFTVAGQSYGYGYDMIGYAENSSAASVATANDGNGQDPDASDPGDWITPAEDNQVGGTFYHCGNQDSTGKYIGSNSSWHGTHVAGLIAAATNNGMGMAGVAGGVKLLPVRVLGKCGGYDSDIMAGMLWAAGIPVPGIPTNTAHPAKVLNMSLGGSGSCAGTGTGTYADTIAQVNAAGATVVVAAGNSEGEAVGVPGNCPGVITVAALRQVGTKVGFSSLGPEVSIAAPGGNCVNLSGPCLYPILATGNSGATVPVAADNYYDYGFGTSFSTPLVVGTVALMYSVQPQLTPSAVKTFLQQTVRPFVSTGGTAGIAQCTAPTTTVQDECYCTTGTCGAGMLDAGAAVQAVQAAVGTGSVAIAVSPASGATAGQTITLTASATLGAGRSVASWAWTLTDGGGAVTGFASGANSATATLQPTAAGVIRVMATATDDLGLSYSMSSTITVAAAATTPGSSGGGGGGAFNPLWLLGLMLASWLLRRQPR